MMIGQQDYKAGLKRKFYLGLMRERERLLDFMHQFEANELAGDRSGPEWKDSLFPEVRSVLF